MHISNRDWDVFYCLDNMYNGQTWVNRAVARIFFSTEAKETFGPKGRSPRPTRPRAGMGFLGRGQPTPSRPLGV